ncbi:MAG TPA: PEP-CTERM sorting domain-containing protein [Rhizomicrobium sp.]|nr:PEP-CTERM sorting domain-containing protein [Rhizomicrobium sp.]
MRMPSIVKSTLFAAAATLLATSAAVAGPFTVPGGGQIKTTENSYEGLVTKPGDVLHGIFNVSQINGPGGITYSYGAGGQYLVGVFDGFLLTSITPTAPSFLEPLGGFDLAFSGGSLKYYTYGSDIFAGNALTDGSGSQQDAIDAITLGGGTLELSLTPQTIFGTTTLGIHVPTDLTTFTGAATTTVFLDIVGGASASLFDKDTFVNAFTLALADATYQGSANSTTCFTGRWQVCGDNHATLRVIPEPVTLSLFGAGLAGAAALRRRKAKKA